VLQTARRKGLAIRITAIGAEQAVAGADQTLADSGGQVRERYGIPAEGGAYLLRPDQHICARWLKLDAPRLQAALTAALPR
jgi:3-(3-hydroxy-phenyl)propionate hydroxylase